MQTTLLSQQEFMSLARDEVKDITGQEEIFYPDGVIDIGPYVLSVPLPDLAGNTIPEELFVDVIYRVVKGPFDLVHVMTSRKNVYLVIVIDVTKDRIHGHYLLDLNEADGVGTSK